MIYECAIYDTSCHFTLALIAIVTLVVIVVDIFDIMMIVYSCRFAALTDRPVSPQPYLLRS